MAFDDFIRKGYIGRDPSRFIIDEASMIPQRNMPLRGCGDPGCAECNPESAAAIRSGAMPGGPNVARDFQEAARRIAEAMRNRPGGPGTFSIPFGGASAPGSER